MSISLLNSSYDAYLDTMRKQLRALPNINSNKLGTSPSMNRCNVMKNPHQISSETEVFKKTHQLQLLKRDFIVKLGKYFSTLPLATRKSLISKISAALFGESSYELELNKQAQQYAAEINL